MRRRWCVAAVFVAASAVALAMDAPGLDDNAMPEVPAGFKIEVLAKEPVVRNPCSMAFDAKGRLFVGMGPQYRNPTPDTPPDSVVMLVDDDGDGVYDRARVFATGFNCIQGLAWKGRDLWVANSPDLTIVRDLDGDDEADEYVRVFGDLGNIEHALHGLNWAPDGKLYMSKGNSKGLTQGERVAPKAFRELWGITAPAGTPDLPPSQTFAKGKYRGLYQNPADDWGREGGVLRCDDMGRNLEIVSRGMRNPWDITADASFNWLGTDNDQNEGDRIFMPFFGAHFGWSHAWSSDWTGKDHVPTAPISGPVFTGSGTGIICYLGTQFPTEYRGAFFINDWLLRRTYLYRPHWDGGLMQPEGGKFETFIHGGNALFRPTDMEVGPDGAIYILGWSKSYGVEWDKQKHQVNEGRVFRVSSTAGLLPARSAWYGAKRDKPIADWTFDELTEDLGQAVPVWRINAQEELVRRGGAVKGDLLKLLSRSDLSTLEQTWAMWALGRLSPEDMTIDQVMAQTAGEAHSLSERVQGLRIMGYRVRQFGRGELPVSVFAAALRDKEPRIRLEAAQAIGQAGSKPLVGALVDAAAAEPDRIAFYCDWHSMRLVMSVEELAATLRDKRAGARRAALLALAEGGSLTEEQARALTADVDDATRGLAAQWLARRSGNNLIMVVPEPGEFADSVLVQMIPGMKPSSIRFTIDGTTPTIGSPAFKKLTLTQSTTIKAALFVDKQQMGPVMVAAFRKAGSGGGAASTLVAGGAQEHFAPAVNLAVGAKAYTDRAFTYTELPSDLLGAEYLQTANSDSASGGASLMSFEALRDVKVFVGHDRRIAGKPGWMKVGAPDGFAATGTSVRTKDATFDVFAREFAAGMVTLGGNADDGKTSGRSQYVVILKAQPLKPLTQETTADQVRGLLASAKPERGRALFMSLDSAGCANCHRVGAEGRSYGPDLSGVGERGTTDHLIESILSPNAVITEGFATQLAVTAAGPQMGVLVEETDTTLTLAQPGGGRVRIAKGEITTRQSLGASSMTPFNFALSPQQVADIVAWLSRQKVSGPSASP